jgi:hypothetical protein
VVAVDGPGDTRPRLLDSEDSLLLVAFDEGSGGGVEEHGLDTEEGEGGGSGLGLGSSGKRAA